MAADSVLRRVAGLTGGALLAPGTGLVSRLRRGRMFHPRGTVLIAAVRPDASTLPAERALAQRLAGSAIVRLSSAWWKRREWPDVLGCAIRFTRQPVQSLHRSDDQDLLFATVRRPWTLPLSPLGTDHRDFLANDYYAVSPFEVEDLGLTEWRLRPLTTSPPAQSRLERLLAAVTQGAAGFELQYAPYRPPHRIADERPFRRIARIELIEPAALDQDALRFDPFHTGRGIVPVGIIHGLRRNTYAASRRQPRRRDVLEGT